MTEGLHNGEETSCNIVVKQHPLLETKHSRLVHKSEGLLSCTKQKERFFITLHVVVCLPLMDLFRDLKWKQPKVHYLIDM